MTTSDKFISSCERLRKAERVKAGNALDAAVAAAACEKIVSLFERTAPKYGSLPQALACYWQDSCLSRSPEPEAEPSDSHLRKLAAFLSFLLGEEDSFEQLAEEDWKEMADCVNAEAGSLPLDALTQMMNTIMERVAL